MKYLQLILALLNLVLKIPEWIKRARHLMEQEEKLRKLEEASKNAVETKDTSSIEDQLNS